MSFRRYDGYKDSGVEWLDEVPKHWRIASLRHGLAEIFSGVTVTQVDLGEGTVPVTRIETISAGVIDEKKLGYIPASEAREDRRLHVGDILFSNINSLKMIGNCAVYLGGGTIYAGMNLLVLRPSNDISHEWLAWVIRCPLFRQTVESLAKPAINQASISQGSLLSILIVTPPIAEQFAIAAFLDRETAKIDALVAEQQRLIELLKEKWQAVISRAVTKGLDPNAPMKNSGIEWLGEVPEHWATSKLGSLFAEVSEEGNDELPVLSVSIHDGVSDRELRDDELDRKVTRSDDRSKYKRVRPGDLAYNMMRAWQGGFGAVMVEGMVSPAYVVARPKSTFSAEFVEHLLRTPNAVEEMRRYSRGVTDFRLRLYWDEFKGLTVAVPPPLEQAHILEVIRRETLKVTVLSMEAEAAITLLQERRSALISAAITGKIDVRGFVDASEQIPDVVAA
jgi:type I restriction enzyme, S subunit